jgi:hypothetical protein
MPAPGANVPLTELAGLLGEISPAMRAIRDNGPPGDAAQAALSGYAARLEALAGSGRRTRVLPRRILSDLVLLGHSLRILAGEVPARRGQTPMGLAKECSMMLASLRRTVDQAAAAP